MGLQMKKKMLISQSVTVTAAMLAFEEAGDDE